MDVVLKDYKIATCRKKLLAGYPKNSCEVSQEFIDLEARSTIAFALVDLQMGKKSKRMTYTIQATPTTRLFASLAADVDGLCIVPMTTSMSKIDKPDSVIFTATLEDGTTWKLGKQQSEKCVGEIWCLRHVDDRKLANMVLQTMIAKVDTPRRKWVQVSIVCAVNHVAIVKDSELVLYIPSKKKKVTDSKAAGTKRARVS